MNKEISDKILKHAKETKSHDLSGLSKNYITILSTSIYCNISKVTAKHYLLQLTIQKKLKMFEEGEGSYKYRFWRLT